MPSTNPPPETGWIGTSHVTETGDRVIGPCPPATRSPRENAIAIATRGWEDVPLPAPKPYIAPGWAITGKLAYLETRNQTHFEYSKQTEVGTLEIVATGKYTVDWGDGETSWPYSVEGKPWPDGQVTHEYIWARSYDIVVTEHWTAMWRLGPWSGTLRELQTVGRIGQFPAREIQAVIRS